MAVDPQDNADQEWDTLRLRDDEEMEFFTELALHEAERWIQAVTRKKFEHADDFRKSLGNGVLLCELLNCLKAGAIKRINKLPGAIAGMDNINVFLAACEKSFGLNKTQLFDPSDLEDLSHRAIADENEYLLKQETDRRSRNVAITIFWLGRVATEHGYNCPTLDSSAFSSLVHSHGTKNIISNDCFKNGTNPVRRESAGVIESGKINSKVNNNRRHTVHGHHIRDSSYDSLGSYERESDACFDELDAGGGNMPVRSADQSDMHRYNSAGSLNMPRDMRLSTASHDSVYSDDKQDSMYRSSPDLSQGSHAHTRSSSNDSAEGGYYGNHSRQSSGSTGEYPTRRVSTAMRKTSTSGPDPLQFIKVGGAQALAENAKKQMAVAKEVNIMRGKVEPSVTAAVEEPDWQSNFNNWKSRRKSAHGRLIEDFPGMEEEEKQEEVKKPKTYAQMMEEKASRQGRRSMHVYPLEDDELPAPRSKDRRAIRTYPQDDDSGISVPTTSKSSTLPKVSNSKNKKGEEIANWARDSSGEDNSQSDSEMNSHQSGDTDSVFSDKSTPNKILSDDDTWVKNKPNSQTVPTSVTTVPSKVSPLRSLPTSSAPNNNVSKLWENNVGVNESHVNKGDNKPRALSSNNSAKIKDITKAFEKKETDARTPPSVTKRSEFRKMGTDGRPAWKSLDLSDKSHQTFSTYNEKKPTSPLSPLSPTAPKALMPKEQRFPHSNATTKPAEEVLPKNDKKFIEKTIKISQRANNSRGFGFTLVGGMEKKLPVTVQRVSLGSAADVQDVLANDELIAVNGRDVSILTLAQVQGIVDHAVKRGQIELRVKRYAEEDESYDSMEEEESASASHNNNNSRGMFDQSEDSSLSLTDPASLEEHHQVSQISVKTDETGKPRLMDQLIGEQQRETNNNEKNTRAPSPVAVEALVTADTQTRVESAPARPLPGSIRDIGAPADVRLTEERPVLSVTRSPVNSSHDSGRNTSYDSEQSPVVLRRKKTPENSPAPPTPPSADPPALSSSSSSGDSMSAGGGPPAALMRWQRPRAKSEYKSPFPTVKPDEDTSLRSKRMSSTLPYTGAAHTFTFDTKYSLDDTSLDKVTEKAARDYNDTVSQSKPIQPTMTQQFNDNSRIEEWQQKQDQQRMPDPKSYPPIELQIPKEEGLTAQSAAPTRKVAQFEAPNLSDIAVPDFEAPLSPQEKFEKDQRKIRLQYEEEKRKAKEAEKHKHDQEKKVLNSDKFLQSMESQIIETRQEAANQNACNSQPISEPRFSSEPMTIKLPSSNQGRPLMIDPRNQSDAGDVKLPEYSFRVDLSKQESAPPLRTLNTAPPELTSEQILEAERKKVREEEQKKFEEWKIQQERQLQEKEEKIRQEAERLQREQAQIEREKALLEQKKQEELSTPAHAPPRGYQPGYQPTSIYLDSRSPTGSSSSPSAVSPTQRHSPAALSPKFQAPKVPPPTAPKPDKGSKEKARLTRQDLMAMNRKATPLTKPDNLDEAQNDSLSPTTREAPSKGELHSLNAVPKQKFRSSAAWIKDEDSVPQANNTKFNNSNTQNSAEKPFVIGNRSDLIHQRDYSNPSDHWVVREAEKRRLADKRDNVESITARAGPTKPSQSSLVNRFRSDVEPPPRSNRFSYPSSHHGDPRDPIPSRPLSTSGSNIRNNDRNPEKGITTQFSARSQPNTFATNNAQTLPPSFSFNANARNHDASIGGKPPRSLTEDGEADPVIAVSGKQKCSHCGEELGFGAAMVIESLGLYYHVQCFSCCVCHMALGNGSEGADVRVRVDKLHCRNCYSNDEAGLKFSKV